MNTKRMMAAALALALLLVPTAQGSAPVDKNDFGKGFLEPDPPEAPRPKIDRDALGKILKITATNVSEGDHLSTVIGGMALVMDVKPDRSMLATLHSGAWHRDIELPSLPTADPLDFTVLVTPFTTSIDRYGDNGPAFPADAPAGPGEVDREKIRDMTVVNYGAVTDLDHSALSASPEMNTTVEIIDLQAELQGIVKHFIVDPDSSLVLLDEAGDVDPLELVAIDAAPRLTDAPSIESALTAISVDSLSLESVLSTLESSSKELGVVDLDDFSLKMVEDEMGLKDINDLNLTPKTVLDIRDLENVDLAIINGGAGKIALLAGEDYGFDEQLVTNLKDPDADLDTRFYSIADDRPEFQPPETDPALLSVVKEVHEFSFDAEVGNYGDILNKLGFFLATGPDVQVPVNEDGCFSVPEGASKDVDTLCFPSDTVPTLSSQIASTVSNLPTMLHLMQPEIDLPNVPRKTSLCAVTCGLSSLNGQDLPGVNHEGILTVGKVGGVDQKAPVPEPGKVKIPEAGIGSLPDITPPEGPQHFDLPDTTQAGLPDPDFSWVLIEHWDAPALPEVNPVVPLDPTNQVIAMAMDKLGGAMTAAPLDVLEGVPLGQTTELVLRFVGESGSLFSNRGISGVSVTVSGEDPLGLVSTQTTQSSNQNGYTTFQVPSMGTWRVEATHESYLPVEGSGVTSVIGGKEGQKYTMKSDTGNAAKDFATDNSMYLLLFALVAIVAGYWLWQKRRR